MPWESTPLKEALHRPKLTFLAQNLFTLDFINTLEKELNKKIKRHYLPMQKGDVYSTLSDSSLLKRITGYNPKTNYKIGIKKFIEWYLSHYKINNKKFKKIKTNFNN